MPTIKGKEATLVLTIPGSLHSALASMATEQGRSIEGEIILALIKHSKRGDNDNGNE